MSDEPWNGRTERRKHTLHGQQEILIKLDLLSAEVQKVVRFIEGNGNPAQGAIVRLDRVEQNLEQSQRVHERHSAWMWGSIGGLGVKAVWDFLTKAR